MGIQEFDQNERHNLPTPAFIPVGDWSLEKQQRAEELLRRLGIGYYKTVVMTQDCAVHPFWEIYFGPKGGHTFWEQLEPEFHHTPEQ